jgi:hypothetical protein
MSLIGVQIVLDSRSSSAIPDHSAATPIRLFFGVIGMDMVFSNKLVPTDSAHGNDLLPICSLYIECCFISAEQSATQRGYLHAITICYTCGLSDR